MIRDDNVLTREMIKELLKGMGHEVPAEAGSGDEALKLYPQARPDLVLLDMIMPGRSGLDTLKELRAMDPAARVLVATAVQQELIERQLLESGAAGILHKPFNHEELAEALRKLSA
jgi:two-component system chemotaxis response regulator CheY